MAASDAVETYLYKKGWVDITVHHFSYIKATRPVAEALELSEGDVVQHAVRVFRLKDNKDNKPFSYLLTYVPEDIGRLWSQANLEKEPLQRLCAKHGIVITLVQEQVTATLADMLLSQRLEVAAGSPILKIRRVAYDAAGRAIEHMTGFYPPDRYHYEVTLPRKGGSVRTK